MTTDSDNARDAKGVGIAAAVIAAWSAALGVWLSVDIAAVSAWLVAPAVVVQTFLYTGLFITAHDAMHGTIAPGHRGLNNAIGAIAVRLYALFSFKKLDQKHRQHHRQPASDDDPDYHDGTHQGGVRWYVNFVGNYVGWAQILGMAVVYNILVHLVGISVFKLNVFWVLPALLSTVQLFYFGTYLPHRRPDTGYEDAHRARSNAYGTWVSFLTCYHFGYHWEHHERPDVPWWQLPRIRRQRQTPGDPS